MKWSLAVMLIAAGCWSGGGNGGSGTGGSGATCRPVAADASSGIAVTPLGGVGDAACYTSLSGLAAPVLNFLKGCWAYSVGIDDISSTDATIESQERAVALDAIVNL